MVDEDWRAICFSSGEPRGLSVSLPEILDQLKEVVGDGPAMVGFDRGGSYPKVFSALYQAGIERNPSSAHASGPVTAMRHPRDVGTAPR